MASKYDHWAIVQRLVSKGVAGVYVRCREKESGEWFEWETTYRSIEEAEKWIDRQIVINAMPVPRGMFRVPLRTAFSICYEALRDLPVVTEGGRLNGRPIDRMTFFWATFIRFEVPVYAEKPPCERPELVRDIHMLSVREGSDDLFHLHNSCYRPYIGARVSRFALWRHLRRIKKLRWDTV